MSPVSTLFQGLMKKKNTHWARPYLFCLLSSFRDKEITGKSKLRYDFPIISKFKVCFDGSRGLSLTETDGKKDEGKLRENEQSSEGSVSSFSPSNSTDHCDGVCGGLILPYPFGFSHGCPIRFTCFAEKQARIGAFSVQNVTEDSIFLHIPHDCHRSIEAMKPLFGENHAPTSENSFLMEQCTNATDGCSIKQRFLETQLKLQSCEAQGNVSCFSADANSSSAKFFSMKDLRKSSCKLLFSSIALESVGASLGIALEFERVDTPDGNAGHRCSCPEGYHGDGFIESPWKKGTVGGAFLLAGLALLFASVDFTRPHTQINLAALAVDKIGLGCLDDIIDPILDVSLDAWTLSSIHTVAELAFRCLSFHSDTRPTMTEVADELEQIRLSGWIPNMGLDSPTGSERSATVKKVSAGSRRLVVPPKQPDILGFVEEKDDSSPVSVQDPWLSAQSSPSTNTLLGNIPRKVITVKMMTPLNLILIVIVIVIVIGGSVSSSPERCDGACGGMILPYPFGFSHGCPIRFDCFAAKQARIGTFSVQNVTGDSIFALVPHDCSRSVEAMKPLFGERYAPTSENSFLMEQCTNQTDGCSIKQRFLETQLKLQSCEVQGNVSCFSADTNSSSTKFFSMKDLRNSSCKMLFSSIAFESVGASLGIALEFERVRLGWWLKGGCGTGNSTCAAYANCKEVDTPDGNAGHRCSCPEGYLGDGFIESPCKKG
ncbi:hypothetical protein Bca52824_027899 [Brassica carinata]|uniref:Wall-associated receptor kinase-like 14 n=1 Tax=Brassica carinata TaxID=52824 RepID=A0A8X7VBG0_BRACI|nr:hypothetical protein Bca52824_027899 [Brassica carinata]